MEQNRELMQLVELRVVENRIADGLQRAYGGLLDVGRALVEAKEKGLVPAGHWTAWVQEHAQMSERQAQRLMQAAREVKAGSALERLPISKVQEILTLPEPERESMAARTEEESLTVKQLREEIRKAKEREEKAADGWLRRIEAEKSAARAEGEKAAEEVLRQRLKAAEERAAAMAASARENGAAAAAAEVQRLRAEVERAERIAREQAEKRQAAQHELLEMKQAAARNSHPARAGLSAGDVTAAARALIGAAGMLPSMGRTVARWSDAEQQELWSAVQTVRGWVADSERMLSELEDLLEVSEL